MLRRAPGEDTGAPRVGAACRATMVGRRERPRASDVVRRRRGINTTGNPNRRVHRVGDGINRAVHGACLLTSQLAKLDHPRRSRRQPAPDHEPCPHPSVARPATIQTPLSTAVGRGWERGPPAKTAMPLLPFSYRSGEGLGIGVPPPAHGKGAGSGVSSIPSHGISRGIHAAKHPRAVIPDPARARTPPRGARSRRCSRRRCPARPRGPSYRRARRHPRQA